MMKNYNEEANQGSKVSPPGGSIIIQRNQKINGINQRIDKESLNQSGVKNKRKDHLNLSTNMTKVPSISTNNANVKLPYIKGAMSPLDN